MAASTLNNRSVLNLEKSDPTGCNNSLDPIVIGNYSSFKKRLDDKLIQSIYPLVSFKDVE